MVNGFKVVKSVSVTMQHVCKPADMLDLFGVFYS